MRKGWIISAKTLKPPSLQQEPHTKCVDLEIKLAHAIGREVQRFRKRLGITIVELAGTSGLSTGMISKIENGATSPSLTSLEILATALGVPISEFFRSYEQAKAAVHVKAGEGFEAERRGSRAGHQYKLLGHIGANASGVVVEPYLISLTSHSDTFPAFQHQGLEILYMLSGVVDYAHSNNTYRLAPGDSLFFDADAPHGPKTLIELPASYLSIISYKPPE